MNSVQMCFQPLSIIISNIVNSWLNPGVMGLWGFRWSGDTWTNQLLVFFDDGISSSWIINTVKSTKKELVIFERPVKIFNSALCKILIFLKLFELISQLVNKTCNWWTTVRSSKCWKPQNVALKLMKISSQWTLNSQCSHLILKIS